MFDSHGYKIFANYFQQDIVLRICQNGSLDVNSVDFAGYTALHESAAEGHVRIAKTLLAYGANVDAASLNDGIRFSNSFLILHWMLI